MGGRFSRAASFVKTLGIRVHFPVPTLPSSVALREMVLNRRQQNPRFPFSCPLTLARSSPLQTLVPPYTLLRLAPARLGARTVPPPRPAQASSRIPVSTG